MQQEAGTVTDKVQIHTYIFLSKINEVLQVYIITICLHIVVNKEVELIFNPVLKNKGQDPCSQLKEKDQPQEDRKLQKRGKNNR